MKILCFGSIFFTFFSHAQTASDLLRQSDVFRGGGYEKLEWSSNVTTVENGNTTERSFSVKADTSNAFVHSLTPVKYKNEIYLINKNSMWFYKPTLKKPISISSRQKLSGMASNGDIASINYSRDYASEIEKTDVFNGQEVTILILNSKSKGLTYDKIRYWIVKKNKLAVHAEFLDLSDKPFKKANMKYENFVLHAGKKVPFISELEITDANNPSLKSTILYSKVKLGSFSDSIFNINNLTR